MRRGSQSGADIPTVSSTSPWPVNADEARFPEAIDLGEYSLRKWEYRHIPRLEKTLKANREHLRPWMPWIAQEPLSRARRIALFEEWHNSWLQGTEYLWGIFSGKNVVGSCGLHRRVGDRGLEIGYWVDRRHTNRGIATRSARALADLALSSPDTDRVEIHHDEANQVSGRIPLALGFTHVDTVHRERTRVSAWAPSETGVSWIWRKEKPAKGRDDVSETPPVAK